MAHTLQITLGRQLLKYLATKECPIEGYMLLFLIAKDRDCARAYNRHFFFPGKLFLDLAAKGYLKLPKDAFQSADKLLAHKDLQLTEQGEELLKFAVSDGNAEWKEAFKQLLRLWPSTVLRTDGTTDKVRSARRADAEKAYMQLMRDGHDPADIAAAAEAYITDISRQGKQCFLLRPVTWLRNYTPDENPSSAAPVAPSTPYGGRLT